MARQLTTHQASKTKKQKGFTLIELMVVTAVAGVLGAVAMPKFIDAKRASETKAIISETVGLGKECASWHINGGVNSGMPAPGSTTTRTTDDCSSTGTTTFSRTITDPKGMIGNVICISEEFKTTDGDKTVNVNVTDIGDMTCSFV